MPDQTKVVLKKVSDSLRQAAGLQPTPASAAPAAGPTAPAAPKGPPADPKAKPAVGTPERRAEGPAPNPRPRP